MLRYRRCYKGSLPPAPSHWRGGAWLVLLLGMLYSLPSLGVGVGSKSGASWNIEKRSDSLYVVTLTTDSTRSEWSLSYPAYQFQTGDIDGDGMEDVMVGVVKTTRYDPKVGRRIFIFRQKRGKIRPLWMGTRLGGRLIDFCYSEGTVIALEGMGNEKYAVSQYRWDTFGMTYVQSFVKETDYYNANKIFKDYEKIHHPLFHAHADPQHWSTRQED